MCYRNAIADLLTKETLIASMLEQALESHALHHQNALAFRRMFNFTQNQDMIIVKISELCPDVYQSLKWEFIQGALRLNFCRKCM